MDKNTFRLVLIFFFFSSIWIPRSWADPLVILNDPSLVSSTQVLVVEANKDPVFKAKLTAWKEQDKIWKVFASMDAVIGRNGIAAIGQKREGDGKTPAGTFDLGLAFGYDPNIDSKMNYRQSTDEDVWVDDVNSKNYNHWINIKDAADAKSFEQMKRQDDLYKAGLVIEYNTKPVVAGMGSAIFLHIWRSAEKPTAGCVALSQENVLKLLKWLDPVNNPVIVILSQ